MIDYVWLASHIGSLDDAIIIANKFYWNLSVKEVNGQWIVFAGDQAILRSDDRDIVDGFLYGMGLAYSVIPDIDGLREKVRPWFE